MINPLTILKKLKTDYPAHRIQELELETVGDFNNSSEELDVYGAILTLIRRAEDVIDDPILFSQVCLGLCGIAPDFYEFEFPAPEMIYTFFDFLDKGKLYFPFELPGVSDDVKYYIAVCLAEEGIFFVKGELEGLQPYLQTVFSEVYGNPIKDEDMKMCEDRWNINSNKDIKDIPENDNIDIQVKQNVFMRDYSSALLKS